MQADAFLVEDYKLKLDYLKSQFDRMWTRFNYFLGIEVGLFGYISQLAFDEPKRHAMQALAGVGFVVSLLWYVVAAQDRALVTDYRSRVKRAARRIASRWNDDLGWYENEHVAAEQKSIFTSVISWYSERISITRLPAILSISLSVIWLLLIFWAKG